MLRYALISLSLAVASLVSLTVSRFAPDQAATGQSRAALSGVRGRELHNASQALWLTCAQQSFQNTVTNCGGVTNGSSCSICAGGPNLVTQIPGTNKTITIEKNGVAVNCNQFVVKSGQCMNGVCQGMLGVKECANVGLTAYRLQGSGGGSGG